MTDAAIISAQLVDIRNIAAHKCVRLEVHVPVEQASAVMAAFGWPTAVDPVPVAIARLTPEAAQRSPKVVPEAAKEARPFASLPYAQQAALRCNDRPFQAFLGVSNETEAAERIRRECGVTSRRDIETDQGAKSRWHRILMDFERYQKGFR